MKRLFDFSAAALGLLLLALPLLVLTLLVRRKLGRPAFFRQVRPGRHGRPFQMVKFRTMTDARGPDGALLPDADRLTPFGRFLRGTSPAPWAKTTCSAFLKRGSIRCAWWPPSGYWLFTLMAGSQVPT